MTLEWIRFFAAAVLIILGLCSFGAAVLGAYRFGFVLNRMHAAGIGDSLGLLCAVGATTISCAFSLDTLKLILLIVFMWFSSPAASHFLSQVEYYTNPHLYRHTDRKLE